jgi:Holliday junction resolvase RusA-like endonuclease
MLPSGFKLPPPPFRISYEFGFSSKASDIDNPTKQITDILSKRYKFNDNQVYEMNLKKTIVPKGKEFIKWKIEHLAS